MPVVLQEGLLGVLACPVDKGGLMYFADEDLLYNPRLRRAYRIVNGVPVLLAERAETVPGPEHERLISRARDGAGSDARPAAVPAVRQLPAACAITGRLRHYQPPAPLPASSSVLLPMPLT
jgi:uncharacterized protein YbaR (Trm112 family)